MRLSRRQFFQAASGALAFASLPHVLRRAGIASEDPIKVGNILDRTGILNIYSLKQIQATAMAVDEINAAGGLLGRPLELVFYDSPVRRPVQLAVRHRGAGQGQVRGGARRHHQLLARGDAPDREPLQGAALLQLAL